MAVVEIASGELDFSAFGFIAPWVLTGLGVAVVGVLLVRAGSKMLRRDS